MPKNFVIGQHIREKTGTSKDPRTFGHPVVTKRQLEAFRECLKDETLENGVWSKEELEKKVAVQPMRQNNHPLMIMINET